MVAKYTLKQVNKKRYHRDSAMSKAEIILIMILFHDSGYLCLKHFFLENVSKHLCHLVPRDCLVQPFCRIGKGSCHSLIPNWRSFLSYKKPTFTR